MIDDKILNDYKKRHSEWRSISITQLSNANNILLTLSSGLLAFSFDKSKISNIHFTWNQNISWSDTAFVISIILLAFSMGYGISVLISRLYDFRISRHLALTRQRLYNQKQKQLPYNYFGPFTYLDRIKVFWQVIFQKLPFINIDLTKKLDDEEALAKNFDALRRISKILGKISWLWTKFQAASFLLSCLTYFLYILLNK